MRMWSKKSWTQNNEGHKSQFPAYNSCILQQKLRGGNPAHYLNWWFPVHIIAKSIAQLSAYATHFICRCACARRKWCFVIGHTHPKSSKQPRERDSLCDFPLQEQDARSSFNTEKTRIRRVSANIRNVHGSFNLAHCSDSSSTSLLWLYQRSTLLESDRIS